MKAVPIKLGELGTYPSYLVTSTVVFDTYLHVRHDIATALEVPVRPAGANTLAVTLEWMMAGLGPMNKGSLGWLDRAVVVELTGDGGGVWTVGPDPRGAVSARVGESQTDTRVIGRADEFPLWATHRRAWRDSDVTLAGDAELGTRFLDGLRII